MTSTKFMLLGVLVMLLGFALDSATVRLIEFRTVGAEMAGNLAYIAAALFVIGLVIGVVGFFRS